MRLSNQLSTIDHVIDHQLGEEMIRTSKVAQKLTGRTERPGRRTAADFRSSRLGSGQANCPLSRAIFRRWPRWRPTRTHLEHRPSSANADHWSAAAARPVTGTKFPLNFCNDSVASSSFDHHLLWQEVTERQEARFKKKIDFILKNAHLCTQDVYCI